MTLSIAHQDPRKRRDALTEYVLSAQTVDFSLYPEFCEALEDDYELCRSLAIKLVLAISARYGDCLVFLKGTSEQIRLEDDAFSKICRMITDPAVQVRVEAARAISKFKSVCLPYLLATLDKKDELPHSGTFVFGLEDERKDVRMAALDSLCQCARNNTKFAERSIDHVVDMFNDEIEGIRLKAIQCLQEMDNVVLREDQVEVILSVLDSPSMDIREALHQMLARINIASARSLRRCIELGLINLARYPQDKLSIYNCFRSLGQNNSEFVSSLVNELLAVHPYLKLPEQSLIDDNYMATLILIFNAAFKTPTILSKLESHTFQHQTYVRHTLSTFMPQIEAPKSQRASALFFISIFERLSKMLGSDCIQRSKLALMGMSLHDLKSFGMVEPEFRASTEFYRIVIESVLTISSLLTSPGWMDSINSLQLIRRVLNQTFTLLKRYHKLSPIQICCVQQLRIQALAIELVAFINSSNSSALELCDDFIEEIRGMEAFLNDQPFLDSIALCSITTSIMDELAALDQPKPGTVARKLEPLFCKMPTILDQINETLTTLIDSQDVDDLQCMKTSNAIFSNSLDKSDTTYKFTAGLVMALTIDVMIENITDTDDVRLKVIYPDKQAHIIVPIKNHFRLISTDSRSETSTYRLYSTLNICHTTWSEPGTVHVSVVLDYRDNQSTSIQLERIDQTRSSEESQLIEISRIMSVRVHPQNLRWLS